MNIVSGWFRGEFKAIGEPWLDHEERYLRSEEFIRCLRGIWQEEQFTFAGDFYRFRNYSLKPKPLHPQPEIFQGGSSRAARDMAVRVSDRYFTNGNSIEGVRQQIEDIQVKSQQVLQEIIDHTDVEAVKGFQHETQNAGLASPEKEGNWAKSSFDDLVQYNDGFKPRLIGTPQQQIAERIIDYKKVGVDLLLLGFLHCQEEVEFFGREVIPRVRH